MISCVRTSNADERHINKIECDKTEDFRVAGLCALDTYEALKWRCTLMFVLGKKIMDQMLTCLNHPFAAEFLQRWLLILFLVLTHVCVGDVRVLLSLVCKQAHSSSAARAHRYNCTWKPGVDIQCLPWSPFTEPKACWFLPVWLASLPWEIPVPHPEHWTSWQKARGTAALHSCGYWGCKLWSSPSQGKCLIHRAASLARTCYHWLLKTRVKPEP